METGSLAEGVFPTGFNVDFSLPNLGESFYFPGYAFSFPDEKLRCSR